MRCGSCGTIVSPADVKSIKTHGKDAPKIRRFLGSFMGKGLTDSEVKFGTVTVVHGKIIGYVEVLPFGKSVYLCRLKVHRAFRRQGQAGRLVLMALKQARNTGAEVLFAVTQPNRPAARILQSLGAELTNKAELIEAMPGVVIDRCNDQEHSFWRLKLNRRC
jgi:ribosomal protein S18 acetylase RimI-like enzyme